MLSGLEEILESSNDHLDDVSVIHYLYAVLVMNVFRMTFVDNNIV